MTPTPPHVPAASPGTAPDWCAIDFGTSNSAVALDDGHGGLRLVDLEGGETTMPTAVFYFADGAEHDGPPRAYGRQAVAAYVDGLEGRLMRSMKSILGSDLVNQRTDIGGGRAMSYLDVIAGYMKRLRVLAEQAVPAGAGAPERVVIGRPVRFVDEDAERDAQAQAALTEAAHRVGFREVHFQFEPIAAALDHESRMTREARVLVCDIGGGTSDFSLVRLGPQRQATLDRQSDILANHGVHCAGTDFDRHVELASILRRCGFGAYGPSIAGRPAREVPSGVYFDLATWHLINTVYAPGRMAELRAMRGNYADPAHYRRLMTVVDERLGHELAARAEQAKIDLSEGGEVEIDLSIIERGLRWQEDPRQLEASLHDDLGRIVHAAHDTVALAGLRTSDVDELYFTGGSTRLTALTARLQACFPDARAEHGPALSSVAMGLGRHAKRLFTGV